MPERTYARFPPMWARKRQRTAVLSWLMVCGLATGAAFGEEIRFREVSADWGLDVRQPRARARPTAVGRGMAVGARRSGHGGRGTAVGARPTSATGLKARAIDEKTPIAARARVGQSRPKPPSGGDRRARQQRVCSLEGQSGNPADATTRSACRRWRSSCSTWILKASARVIRRKRAAGLAKTIRPRERPSASARSWPHRL